ncbi:MAG: CxxxxCH/CxxCH domain-containing protein [Nitrospirae bacterium]|nr:CxxxxCH/CxxCH domain-containing protein [Nitrospirota bacterium]
MNYNAKRLTLFVPAVALLLFALVPNIYSLDYPHNAASGISCGNCHWVAGASSPAWITQGVTPDDTVNNNRCLQCHDNITAPAVVTHSAYSTGSTKWDGNWRVECVDCHNPHYQRQNRRWGAEAYIATGTITSIGAYNEGENETVITLAAALGAEYEGYYIIPNTTYRSFSYKIKDDTQGQTQITVKGPVDMDFAGSNETFAIVYAKNITDNLSYTNPDGTMRSVSTKMFSRSGFGDDSNNHTSSVRICEVCHNRTSYHRYDTTGQSEKAHNNNVDCVQQCHLHNAGFKASCNACHNAPPATGKHATHFGGGTVSYGNTAVQSTTSTYRFSCGICHNGAHLSTSDNPRTVEVTFAGIATQDPYSGPASYAPSSNSVDDPGAGWTFNYSDGTCSNVYCHGNYPGSGKNTPVTFNSGSAPCGSCHNASNTTTPASGKHDKHASSAYYEFTCTLCHKDIVGGSSPEGYTIADRSRHVNGYVDYNFDPTDPKVAGGTYSIATGTAAPSNGTVPRAFGSCSNIYCHSNVQPEGGVGGPSGYSNPSWDSAGTAACGSCHAGGHGAPLGTGSHTAHLNYTLTTTADYYKCGICHKWNTASSLNSCGTCHNFVITPEYPRHANYQIELIFDSTFGDPTYNGSFAPGNGYSSCSNTYCHSNGTSISTGAIPANTTPNWGSGSLACNSCHGYAPAYDNGSPKANSHGIHVAHSVGDCSNCHYATTTNGTIIADKTRHVNKVYDLQAKPGYSFVYSYAADGGTCTTNACHGDAKWGSLDAPTGSGCISCHGHDAGYEYSAGQYSQGKGTFMSHSTHTENDSDDLRGPNIACDACHDTNNFPYFKSGTDTNGDGKYTLSETNVCNPCHSPEGTYDGVNDPLIGAKNNWGAGVYNGNLLTAGKEKWCAGCHDRGTSVIGSVNAPNVIGDESGAYTYGTGWGFYKTGHGLSSGETYPASGGITAGAGATCGNCHDLSAAHIDGSARTYDDHESADTDPSEYRIGYRLRMINGQEPMTIPKTGTTDPANYRLCADCHTNTAAFTDPFSGDTNFRDTTNRHYYHMDATGWRFSADWNGAYTSRITCITCHNVHGSTRLAMMRDGKLINREPGIQIWYYNAGISTNTNPPFPEDLPLTASTGLLWIPGSAGNVCSACHGGSTQEIFGPRTPFQPTAQPPVLDWTGENGYVSDGAAPDSAASGSSFTFRVTYTDTNNDAPAVIELWVDADNNGSYESTYAMAGINNADNTYLNGKIYTRSLVLTNTGSSIIRYRFYAKDSTDRDATGPATGDSSITFTGLSINNPPSLAWVSGSCRFEGVSPLAQVSGSVFDFRVQYTDADNSAPVIKQVWVDLNDDGDYADADEKQDMLPEGGDGDYRNGEIFTKSLTLNFAGDGKLNYRFAFSDGTDAASGDPTGDHRVTVIDNVTPLKTVCASGCDYTTIQAAVNAISSGQTVLVSSGTYAERVIYDGNDNNKTVRSVCGPDDTVINASGAITYGVEVTGSTGSVVDGFGIANGTIGVYLHHSSANTNVTIENCKVHDNSGGGIYSGDHSSITVNNSEIFSNMAGTGAGMYLMEGASSINDTLIRDNHASMNGGGVGTGLWNNTTFTNTTIKNNLADGSGGGFAQTSDSSTATFYGAAIIGNTATAGSGGGLYIQGESGAYGVSLYNTIVSDNEAASGGGIWQDGNLTALNCTVANNRATGAAGGGAIYANTGGSVTIRNSILWNNVALSVGSRHIAYLSSSTPTIISDTILNNDGSTDFNRFPYIVVQDGGSLPTISGFVSGADPFFVDAANGDYHIQSTSEAVDHADAAYAPSVDMDGDSRPQGEAADIGADEYRSSTSGSAPVLAWTGEVNYAADGVNPDSGENGSGFIFRVHYADAGSGAPAVIQLWLDRNDNGAFEAGEKYDLSPAGDGMYTLTVASLVIAGDGYLNYRFYASDGINDAVGEPTDNSTVIVTAPFVTFASASQSTAGESGTATITLQLSRPGSHDITVPFTINSSSTATGGGIDYSITTSPATITAGSTSANITVTITTDSQVESDETVIVELGAPTDALRGAITTHTLTINDDDIATISVCSTNAPPFDKIQTTIADDETEDGDMLLVCPGTYAEKINFLGKNITVKSQSGAAVTFITGDNTNNPVVTISSGEASSAILDGFTIDNQAAASTLTRGISISSGSAPAIKNCVVEGNAMSTGQNGAGININGGTATIQSSTIGGNAANKNSCQTGCGIYATALSGTLSISNSTISENTGTGTGAGIYLTANGTQEAHITGTTFSNNSATLSGGAIYNNGTVLSISNSGFTSNSTGVNQSGGAIYTAGADSSTTIDGTTFTSNSSGNLGGAIYATGSTAATPLSVSNSTFTNNTATQSGGAINLATITNLTTISSSTISGNSATSNKGGGIYASGSPLTLTSTNLDNNTAGLEGGGIYAIAATSVLTITGGSVSGNSGTTGGGIFLTSSAALTTTGTTVNNNSATSGSGGGINSSALVTVANGTFENNISSSNGGAIYANSGFSITGSTFTGNQGSTGGAIYNQGATGNLYGANTFTGNIASGISGGAINSNARVININDAGSVFSQNTAVVSGGALYVTANVNINGATLFDGNGSGTATSGGAIRCQGGTINDASFTNNRAAASGGALYFNSTAGTVNRSTFSGNYLTAASNGGAFFSNVTGNNFDNCTFYNNSAGPDSTGTGGAIYQSVGAANINYSTFYDNLAATAPAIRFATATGIVKNSIVANSSGSLTLCANVTDGGTNLQFNGTCAATFTDADPKLSALADNGGPTWTMALQAGSAAIDTGTTGTCLATDQRGVTRPVNGGISLSCDKGAYEYAP